MKNERLFTALIANASLVLLIAMSPVHASHPNTDVKAKMTSAVDGSQTPARYVNSDKRAYAAMQQLPKDEPFYMLNMIRYNDKAKYQSESEFAAKGWSGKEAYTEYGSHSSHVAKRIGAKVVYVGEPQLTLIGPDHQQWDAIFIISYPNLDAFLALIGDPEYQKHAFHRRAAVADSRLVRMASGSSRAPSVNSEDSAKGQEKPDELSRSYINPSKEALESLLALPMNEPVYMLNMIRLKDEAEYQEDSKFADRGWTGSQAYAKYRQHAGAAVQRLGGKSIYEGIPQLTLIGPEQEQWDSIFIVYYPNVAALKALSEDPEYQAHAFHRGAGVFDSRLIRMTSPSASN